jgi:7-cyano-7-deazaguanine synthase in queuosine biosynthesis
MSITPKRSDITNKTIPNITINTKSEIAANNGVISISVSDFSDKKLAEYWFESSNLDAQLLGIMEGLVVARLATESENNITHEMSYPFPNGYDVLLSTYGMANVFFHGENYNAYTRKSTTQLTTLLFSGGADSSHLLFQRLQGDCNLVSFNHGQANYRQGIHSEETASKIVPNLARSFFKKTIPQVFVKARWKSYLPRKWAKAYRNFMFITHAATLYPDTVIVIGTSVDDRLHDSFPDFLQSFSEITGIKITAPNLNTGRDVIMSDLINVSLNHIPYYYASTSSCQLQRYLGKKYLQCGSCHSCLLRLPAAPVGGDPRFSIFNKDLKLVPEYLEDKFTIDQYYKRKPSINALKTFFDDLGTQDNIHHCFIPTTFLMEDDWKYDPKKFLTRPQLSSYKTLTVNLAS